MKKGEKMSDKLKEKLSILRMGKRYSVKTEFVKGDPRISGVHFSEDHKKKIGEAQKGSKNHMWGKKQSEESNRKRSETLKGKTKGRPSPLRGTKFTEEHKMRIRESRLRYMSSPEFSKRQYLCNTKPELRMKELLDQLGVHYIFQFRIEDMIVDFYIPSKKLVIEVDGEYWHNYPYGTERDHKRDDKMKMMGYKVIRFWARDVFAMSTISL